MSVCSKNMPKSFSDRKGREMYGYGYSSSSGDISGSIAFLIIIIIIAICVLIAFIFAMSLTIEAAERKGYDDISGKLILIGLFCFPFTPAIIVAALPNKKANIGGTNRTEPQASPKKTDDELPPL